MLNVSQDTTLITMGVQTCLQDVTLNLTSSNSVNKISIETQDDSFGLEQCEIQQVCIPENG